MTRQTHLAVGAALLLALAACGRPPLAPTASSSESSLLADSGQSAAKGGKPPSDQPATALFRCPGSTCDGTDRVVGDGLGAYVGKIWASTGEFNLMLADAARSVTVDYRDRFDAISGRRWFEIITVTATDGLLLQTNTVYPGTDTEAVGGLRAVPVGATWAARMKLGYRKVSPGGVALEWGNRFNPTAYPGSTHVQVTRLSETQWNVAATMAEIVHVRSIAARRDGGEVFEGLHRLPFQFAVTAE